MKNIFGWFCRDIYIIEYQKRSVLYIHLLLFLYPDDEIFDTAKNDKMVSVKLLTKKNDLTRKFFDIISLVILHGSYGNFVQMHYI